VKVEYVFVADYAIATDDGRFNAIAAGIRYVASPAFPHTFPNLAILVSLAFDEADVGKRYKLGIALVGPDESLIMAGPDDWLVTPTRSEEGAPYVICATVSGQHIQFAQPGDYMVVVRVDDRIQLTQTITALQVGPARRRR
jgi:hypothetical protein